MAKREGFPELDCSAPADEMMKLVLRAQVKAMCKLRDKALAGSDSEGVHDMRVCSRRLRSALSDFKPFLTHGVPTQTLRTIANALGAVRDEDVAIFALEELRAAAPAEASDGIVMIADEHGQRLDVARANLTTAIRRKTIRDFQKEFQAALAMLTLRCVRKRTDRNDGVMSFRALGREVVLARIQALRRSMPHLYFPSHNTELHELRILAKRLRYAVELFSDCWGPELQHVGKEVALLQTSLGELHDCDLWLENLGRRLKQRARKNPREERTLRLRVGAGWLVKHFATERTEHYREALSRYEEWEASSFLDQLQLSINS